MPCYKPMLAVPFKISSDTGKVQYKFSEKFVSAAQLSEVIELEGKYYPVKALPCGKCIGCRLDYSKEWAIRCTLELQDYEPDTCWFVTLTYDDEHVPVSYYSELDYDFWIKQGLHVGSNGRVWDLFGYDVPIEELFGVCTPLSRSLTLRPKDLQDFLKRVRDWQHRIYGNTIRFYACGEYGSSTARPHYHLIIYGLQLQPFGVSDWKSVQNGNTVYECKELEKIWKMGNVIVGRCTYETCGYVARYMLKKKKGHYGEFYRKFNIVPEFTRMSLKPGIGQSYYDKYAKDIYQNDEIFIATEKRAIKSKPPRYFDIRAADEFPELLEQIKVERSDASINHMIAAELTSGRDYSDILHDMELSRQFKTKILQKRSGTE